MTSKICLNCDGTRFQVCPGKGCWGNGYTTDDYGAKHICIVCGGVGEVYCRRCNGTGVEK